MGKGRLLVLSMNGERVSIRILDIIKKVPNSQKAEWNKNKVVVQVEREKE